MPLHRRKSFLPAGRDPAPQGRRLWNDIFGATDKERGLRPDRPPVLGGSWGRSAVSGMAAQKRMLEAFRSRAPGAWTDDRLECYKHFKSLTYVGLDRPGRMLMDSEVKVYVKDEHHQKGKRLLTRHEPPHGDRPYSPYKLVELLENPNSYDTWGDLMYAWLVQMGLTGSALTLKVPTLLGNICELYVIPTGYMIPQPVVNPEFPQGYYRVQPLYPYGPFTSYPTPSSAVGAPVGSEWVVKMRYYNPLFWYDGYSPLTAGNLETDVVEQMNRSRWYMMKRIFNPDAVLNFEGVEGMQGLPEEEIERIHAEFEAYQQGVENNGKLFVSTPGAKLEKWDNSSRDLQFTEGWEQMASFTLGGIFGVTKQAAGMIEDSAYATLFATLKQLHLVMLRPFCKMVGRRLTKDLAPHFGDDLVVEVECPRIDDHEIAFQKVDKIGQLRGMPEKAIRVCLDLMEIEADDGLVTELSKAAEEGAGGEQPNLVNPATGEGPLHPQHDPNTKKSGLPAKPAEAAEGAEPAEAAEAPKPGKLGEGSLGPRKSYAPPPRLTRDYLRKALQTDNVPAIDPAVAGLLAKALDRPPAPINVVLPEQRQPEVNVRVAPPNVSVVVPPRKTTTRKRVNYSDVTGRPDFIDEETIEVSLLNNGNGKH